MAKRKEITFDAFVRGFLWVAGLVIAVLLLKRLSSVLLPFFLAWLLAYMLFPIVKFFQYKCKLKYRILAILCTFIVVTAVVAGFFFLIIPPMIEEILRVKTLLVNFIQNGSSMGGLPAMIHDFIREHLNYDKLREAGSVEEVASTVKEAIPQIWGIIARAFSALSGLFTLLMMALYTLFILIDYEKLTQGWVNLVPAKMRPFCVQLVSDVGDGMNKYFRGQAMVATCVGILFSIGFMIIDFPMAIGLGLFIGLLNMVPYLQVVGFIPTILLAIVKSAETGQNFWSILLMALIVFAVVQTIQDAFLTPKIMGKVTGLYSAIVLLSLSIWGSLLGILGMVIALPLTTLILTYYQRYVIKEEQQKSLPASLISQPDTDQKKEEEQ